MPKLLLPIAAIVFIASASSSFAANVSAGKDLYSDNCAICHGNKGEGYEKSAVPEGAVQIMKLAGDAAYWDFEVFKKAVLLGTDDNNHPMRVMPVFGKTGFYEPPGQAVTDDDVANIQAYLQTLGPKE